MALSQVELQEEAVQQLRQLAQSPGWALYVARLRSLSRSRSKEKALALRGNRVNDAMLAQGHQDGLEEAVEELPRYLKRLQAQEVHLSRESGPNMEALNG